VSDATAVVSDAALVERRMPDQDRRSERAADAPAAPHDDVESAGCKRNYMPFGVVRDEAETPTASFGRVIRSWSDFSG
jgi:hypothetical protein